MRQKRQRQNHHEAAPRSRDRKAAQHPQNGGPHVLEWVVGGVSAVLVLAMVGFILYHALSTTAINPALDVVVEQVEPANGGFRVIFHALNRGDATAAGVEIEGRIVRDGETLETSRITLDYVPAHSRQRGALIFAEDPRRYRLQIGARGYAEP